MLQHISVPIAAVLKAAGLDVSAISHIHVGDRLVHRTNPLLSGPVVGVDLSGPVRPAGPCVWVDHIGRQHKQWLRVGENELAEYDVHPKEAPEPQKET